MNDPTLRSWWPLSVWEALGEALALGALLLLIGSARTRGGIEDATHAALALIIYLFITIFARLRPNLIIKYPLANLAPAEQGRLIIGNRAVLAFVKAELVGLFATMNVSGLDRIPRGQMTTELAAVLGGFVALLLATVLASMGSLRPRL